MFRYDNRFTQFLPGDSETRNFRRQVFGACYSRVQPTSVPSPRLVAYSREMAEELGLTPEQCGSDLFQQVFAGNQVLEGMDPFAMCYGGHQFGNWAGQLGDGRAINLAEVWGREGRRWTLQLKGAGPTPYSRTADGLAVLRSSVREFLCSEAMFHLGVPTTRALSLVLTGQDVVRDMFYDGNPEREPGAVVCRVAPSFTRFGNFEILAARQDDDLLRQLANFTIEHDFPEFWAERKSEVDSPPFYADWFAEVCRRTATLMVHWMRVGFVHGVMNTDNMSILGLTIDYGPYGWLEDYDPAWTPNTTDAHGRRYAFGQQPQIGMWNLVRLANALWPLVQEKEPLQAALQEYSETYQKQFQAMMAAKLGLAQYDEELVDGLFLLLGSLETDFTIFFRRLARWQEAALDSNELDGLFDANGIPELLKPAYYDLGQWSQTISQRTRDWLNLYLLKLRRDSQSPSSRVERMKQVNPKYVLRNYLAQLAIDAAVRGDFTQITRLLDVLRQPYTEQIEHEDLAEKRPDWARHRAGCSMLSCSS
ncbi:MAG: YdiU family protein [Pirellulaceae bacterium]|nr:YdiU family protein [Pirellulaceae bacterium]